MNKFFKLSGLIVFISAVFLSLASCDWLFSDNTALSGTVILTGDTRPGKFLTANTSRLNATGSFSYQWKRTNANGTSANISGVNSGTYAIKETDVNYDISVTVTRSGYSGSVESNALIIKAGEDLSGTYHDIDALYHSFIFTDYTVIKIWDNIDPDQVFVESEGTYEANNGKLTLRLKIDNSPETVETYSYQFNGSKLVLTQGNNTVTYFKDDRAENAIIIDLEAMDDPELFEQNTRVIFAGNLPTTITVTGSYTEYKWYVNGGLVSSGAGNSYIFNQSVYGIYELVVVVKNAQGQSRSQRCWITVK